MPNWTFNTVTISGDADAVSRLRAQVSRPVVVDGDTVERLFSLYNIVTPPLENPVYTGDDLKHPLNWYNWNREMWGTKWDVDDAKLAVESETKIRYTFATANGAPEPALEALEEQYPELLIELESLDEWELEG